MNEDDLVRSINIIAISPKASKAGKFFAIDNMGNLWIVRNLQGSKISNVGSESKLKQFTFFSAWHLLKEKPAAHNGARIGAPMFRAFCGCITRISPLHGKAFS